MFFKGPSYCGHGIHHAATVFGCPLILMNDYFSFVLEIVH